MTKRSEDKKREAKLRVKNPILKDFDAKLRSGKQFFAKLISEIVSLFSFAPLVTTKWTLFLFHIFNRKYSSFRAYLRRLWCMREWREAAEKKRKRALKNCAAPSINHVSTLDLSRAESLLRSLPLDGSLVANRPKLSRPVREGCGITAGSCHFTPPESMGNSNTRSSILYS